MRKLLAMAVAATALAVAAPAAAQGWLSINQRQANLNGRINAGTRDGSLTQAEAARLRSEFNGLVRLEARYRASYGLSLSERADLDRRYDALSVQIRDQRHDADDRWDNNGRRAWTPINQRERQLDRRIDAGLRNGGLSQREAYALRVEFNRIARLEAQYRRDGMSYAERRDLERRFDRLNYRLEAELRDNNNRLG